MQHLSGGTVGIVSVTPPGRPRPAEARRARRDELAGRSLLGAYRPSSSSGAAVTVAALLALLWLVVAVNAIDDHRLLRFGIKPREPGGLTGIVASPFLHANAGHLLANTVPFAVLGWLMLIAGLRYFAIVSALVLLVGGLVDWSLGPSHAVIVGASGLVYGWLGYLLARAWFGRRLKWIAIAVAVALVFSSSFAGLLPRLHTNVFWGGHLAGFAVGVAVAALLHRRRRDRAAAASPRRVPPAPPPSQAPPGRR
jgi:membrane associated rhomboid family serine protease